MPNKPFVTKLQPEVMNKLHKALKEKDFTITQPAYTVFQAKKTGISCTGYTSGKLVVQGSKSEEFIQFFLEPEILETFEYGYQKPTASHSHIGIDESGKGDLFGPLCVAGVYAAPDQIELLKKIGVRDSKALSDQQIVQIAKKIRKNFTHHLVVIGPERYNGLYASFQNLNKLLAWGHATTIQEMVKKSQCSDVLIDQFAAEHVVKKALKDKNIEVNLTQRHRGEEDLIVAAASILAREAFLDGMSKLMRQFSIDLPKGASSKTVRSGRLFVQKFGEDELPKICKMHFKTAQEILS